MQITIPPFTDEDDYVTQFRARLKDAGLSEGQLGREANVESGQLSKWLNGRVAPSLRNVVRLEKAFTRLTTGA